MEVLETLGRGHITIGFFNETDPVSGMIHSLGLVGTFKNGRDDSILHCEEQNILLLLIFQNIK